MDMQHREHSKHNEYTFGWIFIQEIYLITCLNIVIGRQSLLSLHMTKSYLRTATRSTLKVEANLTQILNFKANFHTEFEQFFKKKIYANNCGHFKIVSIKKKKLILST